MLATLSVLVIDRSAGGGTTVSLSLALLLAVSGSVAPGGPRIVAVFVSVPLGAVTVALSVKVAVPPASSATLALMLPAPEAGHDEPPLAAQVQVAEPRPDGSVSVTIAPVTGSGPALVAVMV